MSQVAAVVCPSYEDASKAISRALTLLKLEEFIKKGQKVLIKPNLLMPALPERAVTTHPAIVDAVVKEVKKQGGIPIIGDSPGFYSLEKAAKESGIEEIAKKNKVKLVAFKSKIKKNNKNKLMKVFNIASIIDEVDLIINLPKLKTHMLTGMTGAVKNLFGLVVGNHKAAMHLKLTDFRDFSQMLIDLHNIVKPSLTIMDAVLCMEGKGPNAGTPKHVGMILASKDAMALDCVAASIARLSPTTLIKPKKLEIIGDKIPIIPFKKARPSKIPSWLLHLGRKTFLPKPKITNKCIGCGICAKACPKNCIEIINKKAVIDYSKCIQCYCCHENCPHMAIELKRL